MRVLRQSPEATLLSRATVPSTYPTFRYFSSVSSVTASMAAPATMTTKNIVVLGGSYAGFNLTKRLISSLSSFPPDHRLILVEKNTHLNHAFVFPRYSVVPGYESGAFIPYDGLDNAAQEQQAGEKEITELETKFSRIQGTAVALTSSTIHLASGEAIPYTYLAIATGCSQTPPSRLSSSSQEDGCEEMRALQRAVRNAQKIAIVGAGPVGVQLAADVKAWYPTKKVTLVHSRGHLLSRFRKELSEYVLPVLQGQGICVLLNERPKIPIGSLLTKGRSLTFSDGRVENFDLVVCLILLYPFKLLDLFCVLFKATRLNSFLRSPQQVKSPIPPFFPPTSPFPFLNLPPESSSVLLFRFLLIWKPTLTYSLSVTSLNTVAP